MKIDTKQRERLKWTVLIATVIVAILIAFWPRPQSSEAMSAAADSMYQPPLVQIKAKENEKSPFRKAMVAYSEKDWGTAIELFKTAKVSDPNYLESQFFLGHTLYGQKSFGRAAEVFEGLQSQDNQYKDQAQWNAILCYMHDGMSREEIISRINQIEYNEEHTFSTRAETLRGRIPAE